MSALSKMFWAQHALDRHSVGAQVSNLRVSSARALRSFDTFAPIVF